MPQPAAPEPPAAGWALVLPVKGGPGAKTRLRPVTAGAPALAGALALDCLDAVLACARTAGAWVVCADPALRSRAAAAGAHPVAESSPGAGLLAAIADGLAAALSAAPAAPAEGGGEAPRPTAVLLADVPCLRPGDLDAALLAAEAALQRGARQVVVLDTEGTGTVLLAAARAGDLRPRFGPGSAAAHQDDGAIVVGEHLERLRRDVDTPAELDAALRLGVGPRTAAALGAQRSPRAS